MLLLLRYLALIAILFPLTTAASAAPGAPAGVCPPVQTSSLRTIVYGTVTVDGAAAAIGAVVEARSPRGDVVGCHVITTPGSYGMMYVHGEDTSVSPTIPGMRVGEMVAFRVDGVTAVAAPALAWANDWQTTRHEVTLTVTSPLSPVPPVVTIARGTNNSAILTWPHASANASYQVWRGATPYFVPVAPATQIGDGATGICGNTGGAITCTDAAILGNPDEHNFYLVRALNAAGAQADSNRTGEFEFALQPGN